MVGRFVIGDCDFGGEPDGILFSSLRFKSTCGRLKPMSENPGRNIEFAAFQPLLK
jgi:hypothetical protein